MSSLRLQPPEVKAPNRETPVCAHCRGLGVEPGGPHRDPGGPCSFCEGMGRALCVVRPKETCYVATVAGGAIETGHHLPSLVALVRRQWPDSPDDIMCWEDRGEDGCRAVALLRRTTTRDGHHRPLAVTYF